MQDKRVGARLPFGLTVLFCALALWILIGNFIPAMRDYRASKASLAIQLDRHAALLAERKDAQRTLFSLRNDPQEQERRLDSKGLKPTPRSDADSSR